MDVLPGAFHVVALVILVGGAAKLTSPEAFASLLQSLGIGGRRRLLLSRCSGGVEVALGATAIAFGGSVLAGVVAFAYLVFTVVVVLARRAGAASCGCFGAAASPPNMVHIAVNIGSALVAGVVALTGDLPPLSSVLGDQPLLGIPYVIAVLTGAWLVITIDTVGAALVDRVSQVAKLGPTFRANATTGQHTHTHDHD